MSTDRIPCPPYAARLSLSACVARAQAARRDGDEMALTACRTCPVGAERAGLPVEVTSSRRQTGRAKDGGRWEIECTVCGSRVWQNQTELDKKMGCHPCYLRTRKARAALKLSAKAVGS